MDTRHDRLEDILYNSILQNNSLCEDYEFSTANKTMISSILPRNLLFNLFFFPIEDSWSAQSYSLKQRLNHG